MFKKKYIKAKTAEELKNENPFRSEKQLKNLSVVYRYPRASFAVICTSSLLIFFSKPIYDLFFSSASLIDEPERDKYPRNVRPKWLRDARKQLEERDRLRAEQREEYEKLKIQEKELS